MRVIQNEGIHCMSFNQDGSCLAAGTNAGFVIYNCDPFGQSLSLNCGNMCIVEMLFTTSLIALVGGGDNSQHSPRKLQIMNTKVNVDYNNITITQKQTIICELAFPSIIIEVHLNRQRLAVVLESSILLFDISNMRLLYTIDVNHNPSMVTSMSPASHMCYLAYPTPTFSGIKSEHVRSPRASSTRPSSLSAALVASPAGSITLFDAISLHPTTIISAHKSPLVAMAFSPSGRYLSTASEKGTIVRIYGVPDGAPLFSFRRGTYPTRIYSLAFHSNESLLAVSSATETIHIFHLLGTSAGSGSYLATTPAPNKDFEPVIESSASSTYSFASIKSPSQVKAGEHSRPLLTSMVGTVSSLWSKRDSFSKYIPNAFLKSVLEPARHVMHAQLPSAIGKPSMVGFSGNQLMAVTSDAYLHVYLLNIEGALLGNEGADQCALVKRYSLLE